jgi:integrase
MDRLVALTASVVIDPKARMLATPDQQISLIDPDSRSMATSGRGSGVVGYNVQVAVDTEHHPIITHAGLEGVRLHDLRHTYASFGAGGGLGLPIIGKLLGHTQASSPVCCR